MMAGFVQETVNPNIEKIHISSRAFAPEEQHVYRVNSFDGLAPLGAKRVYVPAHRALTERARSGLPRAINMLLLRSKAE
jgi:hypothetical protein